MQVSDVMSERVIHVSPDTGIQEIARVMRDGEVGSVPVASNDRLIGMVTDRDIVIRGLAGAEDPSTLTAADVMTPEVAYCFEDDSLDDVLVNMAAQQIRRLPVVGRDKRLKGIVSLGDVAKSANPATSGKALERISEPME